MAAKRARVRRTPAQWRTLIAEHRRSGLGVAAFCRRRGLAPSSLRSWTRKLEGLDAEPAMAAEFVELAVPGPLPRAESWEVELDLGTGVVLRLRRG